MKTILNLCLFCCCVIVLAIPAPIQAAGLESRAQESPAWQARKRSASQTEWISVHHATNLVTGRVTTTTNSYIELATSLNRVNHQGAWQSSDPSFSLTDRGVEATNAAHTLRLAGNINSVGAIEVRRGDTLIEAHPISLGYFDPIDGGNVILAEITDANGWLTATNEVTYSNCFKGISASLVYKNLRAGVEQFLLLHERPPTPKEVGLSSASRLELFTEFDGDTPVPKKADRVLTRENDPVRRQAMIEPDFTDSTLSFGELTMVPGKAFFLGEDSSPYALSAPPDGTRVGKRFEIIGGRKILIEAIEHARIQPLLQSLPAAVTSASIKRPSSIFNPQSFMAARVLPEDWVAKSSSGKMRNAKLTPNTTPQTSTMAKVFDTTNALASPTFVLDFSLISSNDVLNDYTFYGDKTYRVSGVAYLYGLTTFSGGMVVKYDSVDPCVLQIHGPIQCDTDFYRPAIFTSVYDSSVGEIIDTNQPPTSYPRALAVAYTNVYLKHLRISYASWALHTWDVHLSHSQILHSDVAIFMENDGTRCQVDNVLIVDANRPFWGLSYPLAATHLTIDQCGILAGDYNGNSACSIAFTNCLLVGITNTGVLTNTYDHTEWPSNAESTFQRVGGSSYYLADNSPYRNAGTANITPSLLAALKTMTTFPPVVVSNYYITVDTTLGPQAQRDTDIIDLGYHFSPIDFAFGGTMVSNSTLTLQPGTVLATYNGPNYALALQNGAQLTSEGSPTNMNRVVRYNTVQEQSRTNWSSPAVGAALVSPYSGTSNSRFRFTDFSLLAAEGSHFYGYYGGAATNSFSDCQFHGGTFDVTRPLLNIANCLFEGVLVSVDDGLGIGLENLLQNSSFCRGSLYIGFDGGLFTFRDNLFDQTFIYPNADVTSDHNAYTTNITCLTPTNGAGNLFLTAVNFPYQTNFMGRFYLSTNSPLIDAASLTNAGLRGLYHHTSTTNQVKETNSVLNIGFHYISVNASGLPIDTDGEGLPDYFEDKNGNGNLDPGETDFTVTKADTDADGVNDFVEFLQGRNPLVAAVADTNSAVNLRVYTPLK